MSRVNFISATLSQYNALETKDVNALYFLSDAKKIFKGSSDVTEAIKVVGTFDEVPGAEIVEGKLYINATTFETRIKNGDAWLVFSPGYISAADNFELSENAGKFATIGATKEFITQQIADITGGTAFVKGVTWEDGALKINSGEAQPASVELSGVAHNPVYDTSALKLSIPVYGQDDIVINIPRDNFIRSSRYEDVYTLPDGSEGPAIVFVVDDEESDTDGSTKEIVLPAASLVNDYKGGTSAAIKVTIGENNIILAEALIDGAAGNALVVANGGLRVDVSDRAKKLTEVEEGNVLVATADGDLADGGVTIKTAGELGTSATEVPVASLIAAAITAAIDAAKESIQTQLDLLTNTEKTGRVDVLETKVANVVVGSGAADELVTSTAEGIQRSGKTVGGATLAETPNATTLATEAAVADAVDTAVAWQTL